MKANPFRILFNQRNLWKTTLENLGRTCPDTIQKSPLAIFAQYGIEKERIYRRDSHLKVTIGNPGKREVRWLTDASAPLSTTDQCVRRNEVNYSELTQLIMAGTLRLIDVREPREVEQGMIPSAVHIPVTRMKGALDATTEEFLCSHGFSKPDAGECGLNVVFYSCCAVKSATALEVAHRMGYKKARHYPGGWDEWTQKHGENVTCSHD